MNVFIMLASYCSLALLVVNQCLLYALFSRALFLRANVCFLQNLVQGGNCVKTFLHDVLDFMYKEFDSGAFRSVTAN